MSNDALTYHHFRCENGDGSTKDWAIAAACDGEKIWVRYGATGQTARLKEIPVSSKGGAASQIAMRIDEKISKGYRAIGHAKVINNRLQSIQTIPANTLYWESVVPFNRERLIDALKEIASKLGDDIPGINISVSASGLVGSFNGVPWELGYEKDGGLLPDSRGGGVILNSQGPLPILILIALQQVFPDTICFANCDGNTVKPQVARNDPYLGASVEDYGFVQTIGARLNLCLGKINLNIGGSSDQNQPIWF